MKIAITGADGFLGSHLLDRLKRGKDIEVVAITLFPDVIKERFSDWEALRIVLAEADGLRINRIVDDIDVYIACAFPRAAGPEHMADGLDFVYDSLDILLEKGCRAVVNVSSQSVYNSCRMVPAVETDSPYLSDEYAVAKYCVELAVAHMCAGACVPYSNIRLASLIGPGFNQRFVNKMSKVALKTGQIQVIDNDSSFGFLDVRDAAEGLMRFALTSCLEWAPLYNLGPACAYSISEIAEIISSVVHDMLGLDVTIRSQEATGTCVNSAIDAHRLNDFLGWEPQYSMYDSVCSIINSIVCENKAILTSC